jgi:hypothetical protein
MQSDEIALVSAARRLGLGYHATLNAVLRGDLEGRQDERGRWQVSTQSVARFEARRSTKQQRSEDA